ncbi:hypothetical protein SDC9_105071 [bioreactor metagenome]|uniref:Uncharacterized protein n=1 Tax=bioreactor metagenome TaxID=1076179 RepID=A0A645AYJ7_9ZZZZ
MVGEVEIGGLGELVDGGVLEVVLRQVGDQLADVLESVGLIDRQIVGVARLGVVGTATAEFLHRDVLAGHRADDLGAGDEHLTGLVDHDDEVGECRRIDVAAGSRAHDHADLRDDSGGLHISQEDVAVGTQRNHAFLNAGTAALVDADQRAPGGGGEVDDLGDLRAVDLAQRAAEDADVLTEDADRAFMDLPETDDYAIAVRTFGLHPESGAAMPREFVHLGEAALVDQREDALACGHLPASVLLLDCLSAGRMNGIVHSSAEVGEFCGSAVSLHVLKITRFGRPGWWRRWRIHDRG